MKGLITVLFVLTDLETTGLSPHEGADAVELAYLVFNRDLVISGSGHRYFWEPGYRMSEGAQKVHGLTPAFLAANATPALDACASLYPTFYMSNLVTHNVTFDAPFVKKLFSRSGFGMTFSNEMCTMKSLSAHLGKRTAQGRPKNPNLDELAEYFNVQQRHVNNLMQKWFPGIEGTRHTAAVDVCITYCSLLLGGWPPVKKYYFGESI